MPILVEFRLPCDTARAWEEKNWKGYFFSIIENPLFDLQISFSTKAETDDDAIDVPQVNFGERQVSYHIPKGYEGIWLNHTNVSGTTNLRCLVGDEGVNVVLNV